jgi:hypothetical protein
LVSFVGVGEVEVEVEEGKGEEEEDVGGREGEVGVEGGAVVVSL